MGASTVPVGISADGMTVRSTIPRVLTTCIDPATKLSRGSGKECEFSWLDRRLRRRVSVSAENCYFHPGRSPGSKTTLTYPPPSFPGIFRVVLLAAHLCLQWRDRAGISPDFPFKPMWAPWVCSISITQRRHAFVTNNESRPQNGTRERRSEQCFLSVP
jgi:hypothetical protein